MGTFHILNFGCRASQADGASLKQKLVRAGLQESSTVEASAVAVLNTCTVTATADTEIRQIVRRIHRRNPQCRILVTGCYAQRAPQEVAELEGVAWVVGNSHKHLIDKILVENVTENSLDSNLDGSKGRQTLSGPQRSKTPDRSPLVQIQPVKQAMGSPASSAEPVVLVGEISNEFHFAPVFGDDRTRPTLKIQDGCNARCSFCVIPSVRGKSRSLAPDLVIDQIRSLVDEGYLEVVLSGINLGGYGKDLGRSIDFLGIVERILSETTIARLRISSIEPMDVSPALIRFVAQEPRLAQHFHVPLQSGSDRILRMMNRRYWTTQYAERLLSIRESIPDAAIGADVMVGFPGETVQDHATSLRFMGSLPYTYLHIFPFSARPGTPASTAADQVDARVTRERRNEIREVINVKRQAFLRAQVGRKLSAVTLDGRTPDSRIAMTSNYLDVLMPDARIPPNRLVDVAIERIMAGQLFGYVDSPHLGLKDTLC